VRWRSRRIETDLAAFLLATTSAVSLALYSLLRYELSPLLVVILIGWALVEFAFVRYVLRVLADDRSG
jgi:uncharacterized protein (DUF486 family)